MDSVNRILPPNPISAVQYYIVFAIVWHRQQLHDHYAYRTSCPTSHTYDYIVIGAGSAGSIVSCRLSETGCKSVLLLEAGGAQEALMTDHPGAYLISLLEGGPKLWNYTNVPQIVGQAFSGKVIPEPKGHMIGGTSTVNTMMYQRGNRKDYDRLAEEVGDRNWRYESVLKAFRKSEGNTDPTVDSEYHGRNGPIGVSTPAFPDPILNVVLSVANDQGFPTLDVNGAKQCGTTISQSTVKDGLRSSTSSAFIESGICPKLVTISRAFVTKILFQSDKDGVPVAYGVLFNKDGKKFSVFAEKEIILSAGAISSPQILMLSGVGPAHHLASKGIPLVKDLPVGDNHCNHPGVPNNAILRNNTFVNPGPTLETLLLYQANVKSTGLLAQAPVGIWYRMSPRRRRPVHERDYPDQIIYSLPNKARTPSLSTIKQFEDPAPWQTYMADLTSHDYLTLFPTLGRPFSYGTIRLKTTNPYDIPLIDPRFIRDSRDMEEMVELLSYTFYLIESSRLAKYAYVNPRPIPGCSYCPDRPVSKCESYIRCLIKQYTISLYHPVGGCRMGDVRASDTVVDSRLRVKGIRNLRVVDSSIYRQCINANTNAPSMMIGEMGANLILQDHNYCIHSKRKFKLSYLDFF